MNPANWLLEQRVGAAQRVRDVGPSPGRGAGPGSMTTPASVRTRRSATAPSEGPRRGPNSNAIRSLMCQRQEGSLRLGHPNQVDATAYRWLSIMPGGHSCVTQFRNQEDTTSSAIEYRRTRKEPPGYGRTHRCAGSGPCVLNHEATRRDVRPTRHV